MHIRSIIFLFAALCLLPVKAQALLDSVQGTNFSDVTFPTWNIGDPSLTASVDVCVYTIAVLSSTSYGVTATMPGGFFLNSGTKKLPISVYWEDSGAGNLGSSNGTQLTNNVKLAGQNNANLVSTNCSFGPSGSNARLYIKISQSDLIAALAGTYSGTITIMLSEN